MEGTDITSDQVNGYTSLYSRLSLYTPKSQLPKEQLSYLKGLMLNFAIEVQTLKQHYEKEGTEVLPKDYDKQFKDYKAQYDSALKEQGETAQKDFEKDGITDATLEFFFSAQFYTSKYMKDIDKENPVTDKEIKTYYDENKDMLVSPAQIRASHILVEDAKHTEAGRTSIEAIKAKIDSGKSTFAEMAKENNPDSTAQTGGDLGWFGKGQMVPEFENAAFALKKNEMSDVVETQYGYHLILLTDKKAEHQKTLKEATAEIKATLEQPIAVLSARL